VTQQVVSQPFVSFNGITKVYPPNAIALDRVSVDIAQGTIHAFVGENGAGKSSLMKVLSGEVAPDAGVVSLRGEAVTFRSARDAMRAGIGMVHQEILLVDELSVLENIVLGVEPRCSGVFAANRIDWSRARIDVANMAAVIDFSIDLDAIVGSLSVAAKQKVEIAKLLHRNVDLLILDEPTAVLTPQEIPTFFEELQRLRLQGKTICFISHHLDEVVALADAITVLRDGTHVATVAGSTASASSLARLMVERDVLFSVGREKTSGMNVSNHGSPILKLNALSHRNSSTGKSLGPIDLNVFSGEIVGICGVDGNGQRELVDCIVGALPISSGSLLIKESWPSPDSDTRAYKNGEKEISAVYVDATRLSILGRRRWLAYVPSERKTMGSAANASIVENVMMTHHRLTNRFHSFATWFLNRAAARSFAQEIRARFDVASESVNQQMGSLSGGNQQKVILGRELSEPRPFVLLDQPTRGLDVGSIEYVHAQIEKLRSDGRAVLLVSSDLDEIFRLSDRIVVMSRGLVSLNVPTGMTSTTEVGSAMLEGTTIPAASAVSTVSSASEQRLSSASEQRLSSASEQRLGSARA
jgi:general nucleoside transport system ATP-binding protein